MLKLASKFAMDIFPSVIATILGAYIVNHYITAKPATDAPVAAAVSPAEDEVRPASTASANLWGQRPAWTTQETRSCRCAGRAKA